MEAGVLYSGGRDSTLAALLLAEFYEVTCVTATFGITDDVAHSRDAAEALGFPVRELEVDETVARGAVDRMVADGYPRNGIRQVHEHALETLAATEFGTVADGTRRDDRAPTVTRDVAQSLEDRHDVDYVAPLAGFGHGAVEALAADCLDLETGPSEDVPTGDYEGELRALIAAEHGGEAVNDVFPDHEQSRVVGLRD